VSRRLGGIGCRRGCPPRLLTRVESLAWECLPLEEACADSNTCGVSEKRRVPPAKSPNGEWKAASLPVEAGRLGRPPCFVDRICPVRRLRILLDRGERGRGTRAVGIP